MKAIKYAIYTVLVLLALAIAGGAIFAMTFDPNRYKGDIERIVGERTGRTLKLSGDLAVAVWPSLGAKVGGVTLSERGRDEQFLALEGAHASVALLPLLRGEVIVDGIRVSGLKAQLIKGKDGRFNFQDLLGEDKPAAQPKPQAGKKDAGGEPVKFDIAGVKVERSSVTYRDLAAGQEFAISDLNLSVGRIAERADGKLDLSVNIKGKSPAIDARVELASGYKFDLPAKSYALSKLDARVAGNAAGQAIEARIAAPSIAIAPDAAKGEAVTVEFRLKGEGRSVEALLKLAGVQGSAKALVVPQFSADLAVTDPALPMKSVKIPVTGSLRADLDKQTAEADIKAKIDESNLQARLGLAKFSPPAYRFDVNIDQLNLDRYFPPAEKAAAAGPSKESSGKSADTPVDLSALKGLDANGKLQVGALQARGLKMAKVRTELRAANGRAELGPHSADLYGGSVAGAITAQADGNRVTVKEKLTGVSIGPLLRDFAQQDRLEGRGNLSLDVAAAGPTVEAIKKALAGSASVNLKDGAIKGINIAQVLRKAKSKLGGEQSEAANQAEKTDFSELSATFAIKNGVAHNEDLDVKSPLVRITGRGDIDIGNSRIDYVTKAAVVATTQGQGGAELAELRGLTVPVHLTGTFDNLSYKVNYGAVAADLARSRAGEKVKEKVGERREEIKERLKGLLRR
ncbi:MAG: AsmA family protein [Betaproteobacteria bacterium]